MSRMNSIDNSRLFLFFANALSFKLRSTNSNLTYKLSMNFTGKITNFFKAAVENNAV